MVTQGYDLAYLMSYDDGPTPEEFAFFHAQSIKHSAERSRTTVQEFMVALGSLFDKKVLKSFNDATERIMKTVEAAIEQVRPQAAMTPEEKRQRDIEKTMRNLNKLAQILG